MIDPEHPNFGDLLERRMYSTALLTYHFAVRTSAEYCLSFGPKNPGRIYDQLTYEFEKIEWSRFLGFDNAYHKTPRKFYKKDSKKKIEERILAIQAGALSKWYYSATYVNCEHIARYIVGGKPYCHQIIVGDWRIFGYRTNRYCWNLSKHIEAKIEELKIEEHYNSQN